MKNKLILLFFGSLFFAPGIFGQDGRVYDECHDLAAVTWCGNNKVVSGSNTEWVARMGDVYRYKLDNTENYSYLVYAMPTGKKVKSVTVDFYSIVGQKPTLAVKNTEGKETKYVVGWSNGYPEEISLGTNISRFVLESTLIPADACEAVVYLDAYTDVEVMRVIVEYGGGYQAPEYNRLADYSRINNLLAKAKAGKELTIGVLGGSITAGANAEPMASNCYGARIKEWFRTQFNSKVTLVNAGIGSTNSYFGAIRAEEHLLKYNPDLIIVEYAVNDHEDEIYKHFYEGLLRKLLKAPGEPAVISLMMCTQAGITKQGQQIPIAQHYGIPVVSYNDYVKDEIVSGKGSWLDFYKTSAMPSGDGVHPNTIAHQKTADLLASLFGNIPDIADHEANRMLPKPLYSKDFEDSFFLSAADITPQKTGTWIDGGAIWDFKTGKGWRSVVKGSELTFDILGDVAAVTYWKRPANESYGRAQIWVDNNPPVVADGSNGDHIDQIVLSGIGKGRHKLHVKLLDSKPFEVTCIAVSGDREFGSDKKIIQSLKNQNGIVLEENELVLGDQGEPVTVLNTEDGYLTFKMGIKYLGIDPFSEKLILSDTPDTDATKFLFVDKGDGCAFRSVLNGDYLSIADGLQATATNVTETELFRLLSANETSNPEVMLSGEPVIYAVRNYLCVKNAFGRRLNAYTLTGLKVLSAYIGDDNYHYPLDSDLYIVIVDDHRKKLLIR